MYNIRQLQTLLTGLIGFQRPYDDEQPKLDEDLLTSSSGFYVDEGMHPLLTYDNIWSCAQQFGKLHQPAWNAGVSYGVDSVVTNGGNIYQAIQSGNLGHATNETDWWRQTTLYSVFLRRVYQSSIAKLFSRLANEKKLNEVGKSLLDNVHLFEGVGNMSGRIGKNSRFVGLRLTLRHQDTLALLNYIGLQLDAPQTLTIYLYHSSQHLPVATFPLTTTRALSMQWMKVTQAMLEYMGDHGAGGSFYLGYYEDDLTGQAVKKDVSWTGNYSCGSCSEAVINRGLQSKWAKLVGVQSFYVPSGKYTPGQMWDVDDEMVVSDTNWGMNVQMSVQCDLTRYLVQNSNLVIEPLTRQLVVSFLEEFTFSLRDNRDKQKVAGMAMVALDNQENGMRGEQAKLSAAIKALSFDFSNLSGPCAPCDNMARASKKRSVWG